MRGLVGVMLLGACYSPPSLNCAIRCGEDRGCPNGHACVGGWCSTGDSCALDDAGIGGEGYDSADTPDASTCFGIDQAPFVEICPPNIAILGQISLTNALDTSEIATCTFRVPQAPAGSRELCVIIADDLSIPMGVTIRATGSRPLVLLGRTRLAIDGILDLAGRQADPAIGPFPANANLCGSPPGIANAGGAAGGAPGASGRGTGGSGGAAGVAGTTPNGPVSPTYIRGGCIGGSGGESGVGTGALGGPGGGAVYLISPSLEIDGIINASGGGARVASSAAGGGGGGAGGMILGWSSQPITIGPQAQIFALGGGGSSGGAPSSDGVAGTNPAGPMSPSVRVGDVGSGFGGRGGTRPENDGQGGGTGINGMGGGGGGGGNGFVKFRPTLTVTSMQIAPVPD